jgi:hypothetical protein
MTLVEAIAHTEQSRPATRGYVVGTLNYTSSQDGESEWYSHNPVPGVVEQAPQPEPHAVRIENARSRSNEFTIDNVGFQLTQSESRVKNFYDEDEVRAIYYAETEDLVKRLTGAARVLIFDHTLRSTGFSVETDVLRQPSTSVHGDYTEASAPRRLRQLLPDDAEGLLKKRYAFINVWKPIVRTVEQSPLVLADARSVNAADFVRTTLHYPDRTGEVYTFKYNPNHRWYYFPQMQTDEALLIKCFDSETDGRARFSAHTSFEDPSSPADALPRVSIELRTIVFFD